jgi:hypothetical protein
MNWAMQAITSTNQRLADASRGSMIVGAEAVAVIGISWLGRRCTV